MPEPFIPVEVKTGFRKKTTPEMVSSANLDFAKLDPNSLGYLLKKNRQVEKVQKARDAFDKREERRKKLFEERSSGIMNPIKLRDLIHDIWGNFKDHAPLTYEGMRSRVGRNKKKIDDVTFGTAPPELKRYRKEIGKTIGFLGSIPDGLYNINEVRAVLDDYYPAKKIYAVIKERDAEKKSGHTDRAAELDKQLKDLIKPQTLDRMNATVSKLRPIIYDLAAKAGDWQKGAPTPTQAPAQIAP